MQPTHEEPPVAAQSTSRRDSPSFRGSSEDSSLSVPCIPSPDITRSSVESVSERVYDGENDSQSGSIYPSRSTDGHLSGQHPGDADPVEVPRVISTHPPAKLKLMLPTPDVMQVVTYKPPALQVFKAKHVPRGCSPGPVSVPRNRNSLKRNISDSKPPISIVSSFLPPAIPPELRVPLSFLGKENLQVQFSEADATDLDMKLCVLE